MSPEADPLKAAQDQLANLSAKLVDQTDLIGALEDSLNEGTQRLNQALLAKDHTIRKLKRELQGLKLQTEMQDAELQKLRRASAKPPKAVTEPAKLPAAAEAQTAA